MSLLRKKLENSIREIDEGYTGVLGVSANSLDGEDTFISLNGDEVFPIGSSIKIPILLEFFRKAESGEIDPRQLYTYKSSENVGGSGVIQHLTPDKLTMPLIDYATLMINVSDNVATNILIDLVGMEDVNKTLRSLGLRETKLQRKMIDWEAAKAGRENISTPNETVKMLSLIYNTKGVTEYEKKHVLEVLKKPKVGAIRNSVPDDVPVANKPGGITGASCDMGIVLLENKPYAISVCTKHIPISDFRNLYTARTMRKITKLVHDYYVELSYATSFGRRIN